ncbi:MAG: sigma-70 family RNA polymerase sigma factor [Verrucomicrobiales bacterium]
MVLRAFIISRMPGVPGAADVLQETNLILWKKREAFEIGTNFRAWALTIARNEVRSHLRKLKREAAPTLNPALIEELSEDSAGSPEEMDAWMDALDSCLARLKPEQRELIQSRYRNAKDGVLSGALRGKLHRIRIALRNCITTTLESLPNPPSSTTQ